MKKQDLTTLAMIGISAGFLVSGCQKGDHKNNRQKEASHFEQTNPDTQSFYSSLSSETQQKLMPLDAHGKMMAMEMAKQSCKGQNACIRCFVKKARLTLLIPNIGNKDTN